MINKIAVLFICIIVYSCHSIECIEDEMNSIVLGDKAINVVNKLADCQMFTSSYVGGDAQISKNNILFSILYQDINNKASFNKLFEDAIYPEGRAYALAALHRIDNEIYNRKKKLISMKDKIKVQWYCLIMDWTFSELCESIEKKDLIDEVLINDVNIYSDTLER